MTVDSAGNIYLAEYRAHFLDIACLNVAVTSGPCVGKTAGKLYHLMGNGTSSDGDFDVPSIGVGIAWPQTVLLDHLENVYLSNYQDYTRIRVICYQTTAPGICQGKTIGNTYNFLGTNQSYSYSPDGTDSTIAATGKIYGMNFDQYGNLFLAAYYTHGEIDVICSRHDPDKGPCVGKIPGAFYRIAGYEGQLADDPTGPALTTRVCRGRGTAPDAFGNVYFEDWCGATRVLCNNVTAPGYCLNKTAGTLYRWSGWSGRAGGGIASGTYGAPLAPAWVDGTGAMRFDRTGILVMIRSGTAMFYLP